MDCSGSEPTAAGLQPIAGKDGTHRDFAPVKSLASQLNSASRWVKLDQLAFLDSAHVHFILERRVELEGQAAPGFCQVGGEELTGNAIYERRKRFRHCASDRKCHVGRFGQSRVALVGYYDAGPSHGPRGVQKFLDPRFAASLGCDEKDLRPWPGQEKLFVGPLFQFLRNTVDTRSS